MNVFRVNAECADSIEDLRKGETWKNDYHVLAPDVEEAVRILYAAFESPVTKYFNWSTGGTNFGQGEVIEEGFVIKRILNVQIVADHLILPKEE